MDWKAKEVAERRKRIAAARRWITDQHGTDDGFADWFEDTGRSDKFADAHADWLKSPGRIARWAERYGAIGGFGRSFARWYIETGRTDSFPSAYDAFLVLNGHKTVAEMEAGPTP